jgi:hypothetical protein
MHSAVLRVLSDKVLSAAWVGVGRCGAVRRSVSGRTATRLRRRICCIPSSDFLLSGGPYLGQMVISPTLFTPATEQSPVDNIRLPDPVIRGIGRWVFSRADMDVAGAG